VSEILRRLDCRSVCVQSAPGLHRRISSLFPWLHLCPKVTCSFACTLCFEDVWWGGRKAPRIRTTWRWVINLSLQLLYPRERSPVWYLIRGWVCSRRVPDLVAGKKILPLPRINCRHQARNFHFTKGAISSPRQEECNRKDLHHSDSYEGGHGMV
jgi:hypothetical protein